jgi:hypothetical protein
MATIASMHTARLTGARVTTHGHKTSGRVSTVVHARAEKQSTFSAVPLGTALRCSSPKPTHARSVTTHAVDGGDPKKSGKGTLDSLSSILGIDPEAELKVQREAEEKIEKEVMAAKAEAEAFRVAKAAANKDGKSENKVVTRAASGGEDRDEGEITAPERAIAAVSYLLPLLDGLVRISQSPHSSD